MPPLSWRCICVTLKTTKIADFLSHSVQVTPNADTNFEQVRIFEKNRWSFLKMQLRMTLSSADIPKTRRVRYSKHIHHNNRRSGKSGFDVMVSQINIF